MNKFVLSFFIMLCLVSAVFIPGFRMNVKAAPGVINVPADYPTIQEAVNAAQDGGTILVHNGTYYENIVVNKTVTLMGDGEENTIISAGNSSINVVNVTSSNVNISGFSVNGATGYYACGLYLDGVNNVTISQNNVTDNLYGISLTSSRNDTISNNIVLSNYWGIDLDSGDLYNNITDNTVNSNMYYGIILWSGSQRNVVANNTLMNNQRGVTLGYSDYNLIVFNYISDNSMGIELQGPSNNNSIYHNSFVGNNAQVNGSSISESVNIWDDGYPSGGNFWDDYVARYPSASEIDSSGLWDTPYVINANSTDHYPLLAQIVVPEFSSTPLPTLFLTAFALLTIVFSKGKKRS
jgi:parallel beta-helix repeat protein